MALSSVTVGGKGSSLSPSSLFAVTASRSHVRIDSSALDRLSSSSSLKPSFALPDFFTVHESRASLLDLLTLSSAIRPLLPQLMVEALHSNPNTLRFVVIDLTEDESLVLSNASSALLGVSAILDHQSAALVDFSNAAVTAFNLMDSGDGHSSKEKVGVASDLRVLLNGSKLVGKEKIGWVDKVPKVHGS